MDGIEARRAGPRLWSAPVAGALAAAAGLGLAPVAAGAHDAREGGGGFAARGLVAPPEMQVNSGTAEYQRRPDVALAPGGGFVVVWRSGPTGEEEVRARGFGPAGNALGDDVVLAASGLPVEGADVAARPGGDFVVVWSETDYIFGEVLARGVAADGAPLGPAFAVTQGGYYGSAGPWSRPGVAGAEDGGFVVAWDGLLSCVAWYCQTDVRVRPFAPSGAPLGDQEVVDFTPYVLARAPDVAFGADGGFVVTWCEADRDRRVEARVIDSEGEPAGPAAELAGALGVGEVAPAAAPLAGGSFLVVWDAPAVHREIVAQRLASDGLPLGEPFVVATRATGDQRRPALAATGAAGALVVWDSVGSDGDDFFFRSVQSKAIGPAGGAAGDAVQVNTYTTQSQGFAAVAALAPDDFVVVWESDGSFSDDDDHTSIQARRVRPSAILADGFEAGEPAGWAGGVGAR